MARERLYYCRRPLTYGPADDPQEFDRGQILTPLGLPNDEKLIRLGFFELLTNTKTAEQCGVCGARFTEAGFLKAHGEVRHPKRGKKRQDLQVAPAHYGLPDGIHPTEDSDDSTTAFVDVTGDSAERRLDREAPIHWEKTAASLKG